MLRDLPREHAALLEALLQERDMLVAVAERRAERVQRLHEASAALLRTLDRDELELEVARHLMRLVPADGVAVARPPAVPGEPLVMSAHLNAEGSVGVEAADVLAPAFAEVVRTGRAVRMGGRADSLGSLMAVPLMQGFRMVGVIGAYSRYTSHFSDEDLDATQALGAHAATALVNAALYAQSERERRQSDALASLARALGSAGRPHEVMRLAMRHIMALFGAEGSDVALKRDEFLQIVAAEGSARALQGMFVPIASSVSGRVIREARTVIVNDVSEDADSYQPARQVAAIRNFLLAPMMSGGEAIGVISVMNRPGPYDADDARMLQQFAAQVAVAIVNARLYEEAAEAQREISAAFEAVGDGIAVLDAAGRIVRHNAHFHQLTGLPGADDARGRDFYAAVLHEEREITESCAIGQALFLGKVARSQLRPAWNSRVLDLVAAPHPGGGAVVSVDDVTEFRDLTERHKLVVDHTSDAIVITTPAGEVEFANPAAQRLFGDDARLVGEPLASLVPDRDAMAWTEALARALRGAPARLDGSVHRAADGQRHVSASLAPLRDDGRVSHVVISMRDVTDEAQAHDAMLAANAKYRDLVDMAADAIVTLDLQGSFTSINPAMEVLTGYASEDILGRAFQSFLEPSESTEVQGHFDAASRGELRRFELHMVRADGARRLIAIALTPMRRSGEAVGVLAIARDVSEEREQAAALLHAEARYTRLVEAAEDAIACVDEEGNFTAVNRALETVTGTTRDQMLGRHFVDFVTESDQPAMWQSFKAAMSGERERRTIRFTRPDGVPGFATLVTAPIIENGRITGALGIARDVTEERLLLDQAMRQDKMAAMGELVGGVAHEVNSPLTSILAFAQVLERGTVEGDERAHAIATIGKEAKRAARIVNKLLSFARQGRPERLPSDINQVLRDTLDLRRYALRVQEIRLQVRLMPDAPLVNVDPFQLQQVFINLLSNAEQAVAHQQGERCITVGTEVRGTSLVVSIGDNGPGIAAEALPHIFNPFFSTKPRGAGTGLGLSISDGIIREHHGTLRVRSEPGQGAMFDVELPLQPDGT